MGAYQLACASFGATKVSTTLAANSVDAVAVAYYRSPNFLSLNKSTQATYRREIERWRVKSGSKAITRLERRHIKEQMTERFEAGGPEAANNLLRIIRILCGYAVELDLRRDNPALGIKKFRMRGDVIRMGRQHVSGDAIRVTQAKTGAQLAIPMHSELKRVLESLPKDGLTFLTTQYGKPFKDNASFGNQFRDWCDKAGLPKRSAHGLRKSAAVRLVEAGCTTKEVQAITGHASLREVERYTKAAEQVKLRVARSLGCRKAIERIGARGWSLPNVCRTRSAKPSANPSPTLNEIKRVRRQWRPRRDSNSRPCP